MGQVACPGGSEQIEELELKNHPQTVAVEKNQGGQKKVGRDDAADIPIVEISMSSKIDRSLHLSNNTNKSNYDRIVENYPSPEFAKPISNINDTAIDKTHKDGDYSYP